MFVSVIVKLGVPTPKTSRCTGSGRKVQNMQIKCTFCSFYSLCRVRPYGVRAVCFRVVCLRVSGRVPGPYWGGGPASRTVSVSPVIKF